MLSNPLEKPAFESEEQASPTEKEKTTPPAWTVKIFLLLAGIFAVLVPFEIGFRLWMKYLPKHPTTFDRPLAFYAPADSQSGFDYGYSQSKPANTFRAAVVGDSFTFPTRMQFDDAFPKRLERMLNLTPAKDRPLRAEVINFGKMGASTLSELLTMRTVFSYQPDLVILEITLNDPEPRNLHLERMKNHEKYDFGPMEITPEKNWLLYYWKSLGFLVQGYHNRRTTGEVVKYYRDMYRPDGRWRAFAGALQKMKQKADEKGVRFVATIFPLFYTPLDERYPFKDVHEQIGHLLESINVPYLDLFESFKGMPPERLVVMNGADSHPNEIAHRIVADSLYQWLEKIDAIPQDLRIKEQSVRRGERAKLASKGKRHRPKKHDADVAAQ